MSSGKRLIVTVGLPRSGKSSWARTMKLPIVNPDSIRLAIHGRRFYLRAEGLVWATVEVMVRALFLAGHQDVILDATNVSRKRRDRWRSEDWATEFKVIATDPVTCIGRAVAEKDWDIIPVIERMRDEYEPLGADEKEFGVLVQMPVDAPRKPA